jgi:aminopeptidase N
MKLKDIATQIQIDLRKLTEYALNPDNPVGADKVFMFQQHLGFTQANHTQLLQQIQTKAPEAEATFQRSDEHGDRYQVDLVIIGISRGATRNSSHRLDP